MSRLPSVREVAEQVLREVAAEDRIKTAERQILRGALTPIHTDMGVELLKLAAAFRDINEDDPEVTYDDLQTFMAQCNAS